MNIVYDGHIYSLQPTGGITRYFDNVIRHLPVDCFPSLVLAEPANSKPAQHPNLKTYAFDASAGNGIASYWRKIKNRRTWLSLGRQKFDVCHLSYYTRVTSQSYGCPVIVTVWDMIHELFPEELDPNGTFAEEKRRAIMSAQRVICISENTKKDLLEKHPIPEANVAVTHLAADIDASYAQGPEPVPARPYYLYVGTRTRYKNFHGLLSAFSKVVPRKRELMLCVAGAPFAEYERKRIAELGLSQNVEYFSYPPDAHLAKLYRCSIGLVYPSLYEGFGIPPLEAMACGTVAIVANTSSLPEVVGDAGVMFDPDKPDELIDILKRLPENEAERQRLISEGAERARHFSWAKTVAQTIDVYRAAR